MAINYFALGLMSNGFEKRVCCLHPFFCALRAHYVPLRAHYVPATLFCILETCLTLGTRAPRKAILQSKKRKDKKRTAVSSQKLNINKVKSEKLGALVPKVRQVPNIQNKVAGT